MSVAIALCVCLSSFDKETASTNISLHQEILWVLSIYKNTLKTSTKRTRYKQNIVRIVKKKKRFNIEVQNTEDN